jgi:uncharacterized protein YkwD
MKKNFYAKIMLPFITPILFSTVLLAQSPLNLNTDITWDSDPNISGNQSTATTIPHIENAYNNARRQEENQKMLPANSLGVLTLPNSWATYTNTEKAFFLINAERNCRAGVDYDGAGGVAPVLGLSIEQVETQLNTVAQNHANWLVANNLFQHTGANNSTPFNRIQAAFSLNSCSEFLSRGENIAFFTTTQTTVTAAIERAVYNWTYKDSGAQWGHREACLLQNMDLNGTSMNGYKNNYGGGLSEGMLGVGIAGANNNAYNLGNTNSGMNRSDVVVMVIMDPVGDLTANTNNCNFQTAVALPIELMQFTATQEEDKIMLHWATATERDNSHFIIERASNGKDFEAIGQLAGAGNSKTERRYNFVDHKVKSGTHYYRLVQHDQSGKTSTSQVIAIRFIEKLNLSTYVNSDGLTIALHSANRNEGIFQIVDLNGFVVKQGEISIESGFNKINQTLDNIPTGIYFLSLEVNGTKEINRFFWAQ